MSPMITYFLITFLGLFSLFIIIEFTTERLVGCTGKSLQISLQPLKLMEDRDILPVRHGSQSFQRKLLGPLLLY